MPGALSAPGQIHNAQTKDNKYWAIYVLDTRSFWEIFLEISGNCQRNGINLSSHIIVFWPAKQNHWIKDLSFGLWNWMFLNH